MASSLVAKRKQSVRLFTEAIQHQKRGLNELAWLTCEKILKADPQFVDAHMMQGVILAQRQDHVGASACFARIVTLDPRHVPARFNQGLMLSQAGLLPEAETALKGVLTLEPGHLACLNSLGVVCAQQGKFTEALAFFEAALNANPQQPDAWNNLANVQIELGQIESAEESLRRSLAQHPEYADAMFNLAKLYARSDRPQLATEQYRALLNSHPLFHPARINLSKLWVDEGSPRRAVDLLLEPPVQNLQHPELCFSLGVAYKESEQYLQAIEVFNRTIELDPNHHSAFVNRAACWRELGRLDLAFADMDRSQDEGSQETRSIWWSLYATLHEDTDQNQRVEAAFLEAMVLDPGNLKPKINYGMWLLKQQRFKEAWPYYQYRHGNKTSSSVRWLPDVPIWHGGNLSGRVLILAEQGVGDQVLHSQWLRLYLARYGAPVCVTVDDRLLAAMQRSFPAVQFWPQSDRLSLNAKDFDVQLGMADLAFLMSIDPRVDRLVTEPSMVAQVSVPLFTRRADRPLVGISWKSASAKNSVDKSMTLLDAMAELKDFDVDWVNLQYGDVQAEIEQVKRDLGVEILQASGLDVFNDLDGLMGLIQACDFVVSTSNSTAHFCGAIGQRGVVMVPYNKGKLWYWHTQDGPSPWYPSLHIVHGRQQNDWSHPLSEINDYLRKHLENASPS